MSKTPHGTPSRPRRRISGKGADAKYLFSSPYGGKSPFPMPILLPEQYNEGTQIDKQNEKSHIEIFDKSVVKELEIPSVGTEITNQPFFNDEMRIDFFNGLKNFEKQMNKLNQMNSTVVELNESLGAYLFGLYQNAWCVNLTDSGEFIEKMEKIKQINKLKDEVENLKNQIRLKKEEENNRRKSTMPPPSIPRLSMINRPSLTGRAGKRVSVQTHPVSKPGPKKSFLKAGSRSRAWNTSTNNNAITKPGRNGLGLSIDYATKFQVDDSVDSMSDTSEVQTLNTIRRLQERRSENVFTRVSARSRNNRTERNSESWQVKHNKPFR